MAIKSKVIHLYNHLGVRIHSIQWKKIFIYNNNHIPVIVLSQTTRLFTKRKTNAKSSCLSSCVSEALGQKKNMCVSDFPTDSPFSRRPTHVFLVCDSKFFYWGSYRKKNEVNRTTLREVMRFWRQNFLKLVQILTLVLNIWREISL